MEARTFEMEFAKFIERFHQEIRDAFIEDTFVKRQLLASYSLGREMLEELADAVLSEFTTNIDKRTTVESIVDKYVQLGLRCCEEGLSYSEMIRVFTLLRRHIWLFFQDSNFAGQPFDVRSIVALNNRTTLFFDRAIYSFLVGFEQTQSEIKTELDDIYNTFVDRIYHDIRVRLRSDS